MQNTKFVGNVLSLGGSTGKGWERRLFADDKLLMLL